ncbi:phosphotransferase [Mycobacterium sp. OTB74]|jgi:hypothetical protein|uniref:phosphotransferase n=1 Tax=Mycobacterium sp. OTB74 TaxID=1853452 RepID=UPI002473F5A2|nr:phosphotransferase [Mycobacterium sp. OTB74]MDH6246482.1 hypothetical protein [Mycobacterium sp. OTB74]
MNVPVPSTLHEALSAEWITAALQTRFPGIRIVAVTRGLTVDRITTNALFTIETAQPAPAQLPTQMCVKGYFNDTGRPICFVGEPEASFYRDAVAATGIRSLPVLWADVDPQTRHGVILSADITATGGQFLDAHSQYSPSQVAASLEQLAQLHATSWNLPAWTNVDWLAPRLGRTLQGDRQAISAERIAINLTGDNGQGIPPRWRVADRVINSYTALVENLRNHSAAAGSCVIHGDAHAGNVFLDSEGQPAFTDWQLVQRGMWYLDVGYHIGSTLDVDARRAHERDLLTHYLDCLRRNGVREVPTFSQAWAQLSKGILHGLYLWAITTYVDPTIIAVMLHRLGTAADDHHQVSAP